MTVRHALEAREAGLWADYEQWDADVLEIEMLSGWRGNAAPQWARAERQDAWNRYSKAHLQRRHHAKISRRNILSKIALEEMTATLAARQARKDALVELVDPADIEANDTRPLPIDLVSPLGERGPPDDRASSKVRGPGRPIHLSKSIVLTGMSGGDV